MVNFPVPTVSFVPTSAKESSILETTDFFSFIAFIAFIGAILRLGVGESRIVWARRLIDAKWL